MPTAPNPKERDNEPPGGVERRSRPPRKRLDWDVRGFLAVGGLIGAFIIATSQIVVAALAGRFTTIDTISKAAEIPTWLATMVGAIIGFYFGARAGGSETAQAQQGVQLSEIHALVNSRLDEALALIETQRTELATTEEPKGR